MTRDAALARGFLPRLRAFLSEYALT